MCFYFHVLLANKFTFNKKQTFCELKFYFFINTYKKLVTQVSNREIQKKID
jgi:hypothetical protein